MGRIGGQRGKKVTPNDGLAGEIARFASANHFPDTSPDTNLQPVVRLIEWNGQRVPGYLVVYESIDERSEDERKKANVPS